MSLRVQGDRALKIPKSARPTPSKVRSALFNIWQGRIKGTRWLDLCAGSGAMAAEALLRGAQSVVAIELSPAACKMLHENLAKICQGSQDYQIIRGDVSRVLSKIQGSFELIYFDPPYDSALYPPVLSQIPSLLPPTGTLAVEHSSYNPLPASIPGLILTDRRSYGQTCLSFFELEN